MTSDNIDELDRQILQALVEDARKHFTEIAEDLGVSTGTVHLRFDKLKKAGIISRTKAVINYEALGFMVCAFVGINLHNASDYVKVQAKLKQFDRILEAYYTTGEYNIFTRILAKSNADLYSFLLELQKIKEIGGTETIMVLDNPINRDFGEFAVE